MSKKSKWNWGKHTISRKFLAVILPLVALLAVIITIVTYYILSKVFNNQLKNETVRTSLSIQQTVSSFMKGAYNLSYELAVNPSIITMDYEKQYPILYDSVGRNDFLESLYVVDTSGMETACSSNQMGNRSNRWWFTRTMAQKQPFATDVYYCILTKNISTSIFIPMYDDDSEMIGIFGADIRLEYLQQLIDQFCDYENGIYSFIIDAEGGVVAHPDRVFLESLTNFKTMTRTVMRTDSSGNLMLDSAGNILTEEESFYIPDNYKAAIDKVIGGISGSETVNVNGGVYYISYESIAMPGTSGSWSVVTLKDRAVAMSVITELIIDVILIAIAIAAAIALIIIYTVRRVTKPIEAITNAMHLLAKGDFKAQAVIEYSSDNEIGQLVQGFGALQNMIRDQLDKDFSDSLRYLKPGLPAQIYYDSEKPYNTSIKEVFQNGSFSIIQPVRQNEIREPDALQVFKSQKLKVYYFPEGNRYSVVTEVEATAFHEDNQIYKLTPLSEAVSEQRRKSFRLNAECDVAIWRDNGDIEQAKIQDISLVGALINTKMNYDEGEQLLLKLVDIGELLSLKAEVVRAARGGIGVKFLDTDSAEHEKLSKFYISKQQETLKQRVRV